MRARPRSLLGGSLRLQAALLGSILVLVSSLLYWPGLKGGWLFDDYPNIVDNRDVHIERLAPDALRRAAMASPAADLPRPLAMLSFGLNHWATGLDPFWMKLTNLVLHQLNGLLLTLLAWLLLRRLRPGQSMEADAACAFAIGLAWTLLPINLSPVLVAVQRMEVLAQTFVFVGLVGYLHGRQRMQRDGSGPGAPITWLVLATVAGVAAKESAALTPLYALLLEATTYGFRTRGRIDRRLLLCFSAGGIMALALAAWVLPRFLAPAVWAGRDFGPGERLMTEARVLWDYARWTLLPTPSALSYFHDAYPVSRGLLAPATTLAALAGLVVVGFGAWRLRHRRPLVTLGIGLFFSAHLLTATIIPLELVFEHRNYFASAGLLIALVPLLVPAGASDTLGPRARAAVLALVVLMAWWSIQTAMTAREWSNPYRLAESLSTRNPASPRAAYELGYVLTHASGFNPDSPLIAPAHAALARAASLPGASALPVSAQLLLSSRSGHLPPGVVDPAPLWETLIETLSAQPATSQNIAALRSLVRCQLEGLCDFPAEPLDRAFAVLRERAYVESVLLATHGDLLLARGDHEGATRAYAAAVGQSPGHPAYRAALVRALLVQGERQAALPHLVELARLPGVNPDDLEQLTRAALQPGTPAQPEDTAGDGARIEM